MTSIHIYTFGSVLLVSFVSLIGIFVLSWNDSFLRRCTFVLMSLAVGALFGDAILHLLPEAIEVSGSALAGGTALLGIVVFFIFEKFLHWHHHDHAGHEHKSFEDSKGKIKPVGILTLASDSVHNLIDGLIIGASYLISIEVGVATTLAVILHEIPQELSDFSILIHAGFSKLRALVVNFATALFAILGAILAFLLSNASDMLVPLMSAFAAGHFIYIAGSDIVPELHKSTSVKRSLVQLIAILTGMALMGLLLFID